MLEPTFFRPMLASRELPDFTKLTFPLYASPKLDGVRVLCFDGKVYSRSMKIQPNLALAEALSHPSLHGFDGEFIIPPMDNGTFNRSVRAIRPVESPLPDNWIFAVFDLVPKDRASGRGYSYRIFELAERYAELPAAVREHIRPHLGRWIESAEDLAVYEAECLAAGYEGLILRSPDGPYKQGRATMREGFMMKVKRFEDSEAVVIGFEEKQTNLNPAEVNELGLTSRSSCLSGKVGADTLGVLVCQDLTSGQSVRLGSGWSAELGQDIWSNQSKYLGRRLTYKFFPHGKLNAQRHPIFKGWRMEEDQS